MRENTQRKTKVYSPRVISEEEKKNSGLIETRKKLNYSGTDSLYTPLDTLGHDNKFFPQEIYNIYEEKEIYCKPIPCFIHFLLHNLKHKNSHHFDLSLLHIQHWQSHKPFQLSSCFANEPTVAIFELPLDSPEHYSQALELAHRGVEGAGFSKNYPSYFKMKMLYYLHSFEVSFKLQDNGRFQFYKIECVSDALFSIFYLNKRARFQKKLKQEILSQQNTYNTLCDNIQNKNFNVFGLV